MSAPSIAPPSAAPGRLQARPALAAISLRNGGDGLAYAARLFERACRELAGHLPVVTLDPASPGVVAPAERARFAAGLLRRHAAAGADFWIYTHLGIARVQPWVGWLRRRPYALVLNGIEAWAPELRPEALRVARRAAVRISISRHTAQRAVAAHPALAPIQPCPLALLPQESDGGASGDAVDRELLGRVRRESVLIVGRMSAAERYKGHDQLLECWPAVVAQVPGAQLVVAGRGDDLERLRRKAAQLGIERDVLFAGFVSDATLEALFSRVALFAMPSRGEGFGLVYLQAMRAALPCIGSTADAASDIVLDGVTGYLVDPLDVGALGARIGRILRDDALRLRLGAAGRERFLSEFTFEHFRERLGGILNAAFAPGARRG